MNILSVDPGYGRVGFAILKQEDGKEVVVFSECFETSKEDNIYTRIKQVGERMDNLINEYNPSVVVVEDLFFSKNTKTAMRVAEIRGVLLFSGLKKGLKVVEFKPNQIKVAVAGNGQANKNDVKFALQKFFNINIENKIDDEIDAIAVGLTYFAFKNNL